MPRVVDRPLKGLSGLVLHPRFAENRWIYITYYKPVPGSTENARATLTRARDDGGHTLSVVRDIFSIDGSVIAAGVGALAPAAGRAPRAASALKRFPRLA